MSDEADKRLHEVAERLRAGAEIREMVEEAFACAVDLALRERGCGWTVAALTKTRQIIVKDWDGIESERARRSVVELFDRIGIETKTEESS